MNKMLYSIGINERKVEFVSIECLFVETRELQPISKAFVMQIKYISALRLTEYLHIASRY